MRTFFQAKGRSAGYARDRMKMLLVSERIDCSPQMIKMLRNDLIHTVKRYVKIEEEQVRIGISQNTVVLHEERPLCQKKDKDKDD